MKTTTLLVLIACSQIASLSARDRVAYLKDGSTIVIADTDLSNSSQLNTDPRPKNFLHWLPDGKHVSYLVADPEGAKGRLVVADLSGKITRESVILPRTNPPQPGLRVIETLERLSDHVVRITGSTNPENCELYDFDETAKDFVRYQFCQCDRFVQSPDGKHVAWGMAVAVLAEKRPEVIGIDWKEPEDDDVPKVAYDGGENGMYMLAGPLWSPDSRQIAILAKDGESGALSVVTLALSGAVTKVPVAITNLRSPSLVWVGSEVVVTGGQEPIQVNPSTRSTAQPNLHARTRLAQIRAQTGQQERIKHTVENAGGRQAAVYQGK